MNTALARVAVGQYGDRPGAQVKSGWDRRGQLLASETAAILAIGPAGLRRNRATGIPRRTARHW